MAYADNSVLIAQITDTHVGFEPEAGDEEFNFLRFCMAIDHLLEFIGGDLPGLCEDANKPKLQTGIQPYQNRRQSTEPPKLQDSKPKLQTETPNPNPALPK